MTRTLIAIAILIIVAATHSCRGNDECSQFVPVEGAAWAYGDTISVMANSLSAESSKRLEVAVVSNNDFPYRNLWVEVSYTDSLGRLYRDSVNIDIADEFGRWQGKSIGGSHQCKAAMRHRFPIADSTRVSLRHIMRVDTIRGIEAVGLTVSHAK